MVLEWLVTDVLKVKPQERARGKKAVRGSCGSERISVISVEG